MGGGTLGVRRDQPHPRQAGAPPGGARTRGNGRSHSRSSTTSPPRRWSATTISRTSRCKRTGSPKRSRSPNRARRSRPNAATATRQQMLTVMIATAQVAMGRWDELPQLTGTGELPFAASDQLAYLPALARFRRRPRRSEDLTANPHARRAILRAAATARLPPHRRSPRRSRCAPSATTSKRSRPHCRSPPAHREIPNEIRREALVEAGLAALAVGDDASRAAADRVRCRPAIGHANAVATSRRRTLCRAARRATRRRQAGRRTSRGRHRASYVRSTRHSSSHKSYSNAPN